jgi:hypothetical protein
MWGRKNGKMNARQKRQEFPHQFVT